MTFALKTTFAALALAVLAAAAPAHAADSTPRVDAREARQQTRIANGVASGAVTPHERRHLQRQQHAIRHAERVAKADGVVTAAERTRLHRMQDHASRSIYRQKHDAQVRPAQG